MRAEERRIRKLQQEGRLSAREADQIVSALDRMANRTRAARGRAARFRADLSPIGVLKARFLVGELSPAELRAGFKRVVIASGVAVSVVPTLIFWVLSVIDGAGAKGPDLLGERGVTMIVLGATMGASFAASYYRQLTASGRKLAELRRKVDIARPDLPAPRTGRCASCGSRDLQPGFIRGLYATGWVLLPWLAIHELYLGQRLPRRFQRCQACQAIHVMCDHCEASVENLGWKVSKPYWRAGGMRCRKCDERIPCWRNVFALLLEAPARWISRAWGVRDVTARVEEQEVR